MGRLPFSLSNGEGRKIGLKQSFSITVSELVEWLARKHKSFYSFCTFKTPLKEEFKLHLNLSLRASVENRSRISGKYILSDNNSICHLWHKWMKETYVFEFSKKKLSKKKSCFQIRKMNNVFALYHCKNSYSNEKKPHQTQLTCTRGFVKVQGKLM